LDITVDTGVLVKAMDPMNDIKECAVCVEVLVKILTKCDNLIVSDAVYGEYRERFKKLGRVKLYFDVPSHLARLDIQGKLKYVETFDVNESNIDPDDVKFIEIECLKKTLEIDPNNELSKRKLEAAKKK